MNIPRSSPMEGKHTPTIIQLIRSTDLVIIQLKDSLLYSSIPTITFKGWSIQSKVFHSSQTYNEHVHNLSMGAGQISGEKGGEEVDILEERKHKGSDHRKGYEPKSIYPVTF